MKKPVLFLRIAAVLTLIHAALHTIGGVFGKAGPGAPTLAVTAMKMNQFQWMGHTRSYWDFYRGLGLGATISLTSEAILFWLLASLAAKDATQLRPILVTFMVAYLALSVNSFTYFFLGPVIAEILIAACLAMAIVFANHSPANKKA
jgi:hypothetical protein